MGSPREFLDEDMGCDSISLVETSCHFNSYGTVSKGKISVEPDEKLIHLFT